MTDQTRDDIRRRYAAAATEAATHHTAAVDDNRFGLGQYGKGDGGSRPPVWRASAAATRPLSPICDPATSSSTSDLEEGSTSSSPPDGSDLTASRTGSI